jgi:divalent metal cation (Fe/Co/Zn/Cd) transporter
MTGNDDPPATQAASQASRALLIPRAFVLEWITIAWMIVEVAVGIASGITAHSVSLIAFGVDSGIELLSAVVLVWRLNVELKHGALFSERAEHAASRIGGALLYALAAYVVAAAAWSFWQREGEAFSPYGFALTLIAIPLMYWLYRRKLAIANAIGSSALRADAAENITCAYLSVTVLIGLTAQYLWEIWWADAVASLAIVYFLLKEAREAWQGEQDEEPESESE